MFQIFAVLLLVSVAVARPQLTGPKDAYIKSYDFDSNLYGYKY